eukprot:6202625-Pleurochrysis_carterae.AAC.1
MLLRCARPTLTPCGLGARALHVGRLCVLHVGSCQWLSRQNCSVVSDDLANVNDLVERPKNKVEIIALRRDVALWPAMACTC